jgi:NitT/TauT family transport system substrate-binding protein
MTMIQTRRHFLTSLSSAGVAGLVGVPRARAAEAPLETTTVRVAKTNAICMAAQYVADELLRAEGFTDIRYIDLVTPSPSRPLARGEVDFASEFAAPVITVIDAGLPLMVLAGVHVGCFVLFGNEAIRSITDLTGKNVGIPSFGSPPHVFVAAMAAYVGLDPKKDIHWIITGSAKSLELFQNGDIDAFLGFPPDNQDFRGRHIGHVVVNSAQDRPWSDYFCCMLNGNPEYVRKYPVATKRVVRAILKAADLCATDPTGVARRLVDGGFTPRYDYALQTISELPYDKWREYDAEDTIRFYALRLREAGMIKSTPQKIIADGTDWRFLNELKRELKA